MADQSSKQLLARFQDGDEQAAGEIFGRYVDRLIALARKRLSKKLDRKIDPEDIVQSAYRSFFMRAEAGKYELHKNGDLWRLLAAITVNKVLKKVEYYGAGKRSIDVEQSTSSEYTLRDVPIEKISREPDPGEVAHIIDEVETVMQMLIPSQREMLQLFLQGFDTDDIAKKVSRSQRSVRRCLNEKVLPMLRERLEESTA